MQIISELLTPMTLVKMGAVIFITVALSVLAEAVSAKLAGILTGLPLGAAISLFFIGIEIDARFAAQSALHTSAGVAATVVFSYCYYIASQRTKWSNATLHIFAASFAGAVGYFVAAYGLSFLPADLSVALAAPAVAIIGCTRLFRHIPDVRINNRVRMSVALLFVRALFAASTIVLIISSAKIVGPTWAGLFAAFPNIMLPLIVIIQFTYRPEHAYVIIKNVPKGLASVIAYCVVVSLSYPVYGVYVGTAMAYGAAALYLIVTQFWRDLLGRARA